MEEDRKFYRFYSHSCSDGDKPLWRHGRASVSFRNLGCKNYKRTARTDLGFGFEWRLLVKDGFGVGWQLKWGTGASESTPDLALHFGKLGDLWIQTSNLLPRRWFTRYKLNRKGERVEDYDTRVFSFNVSLEEIRWQFWDKQHHWSSTQPWWYTQTLNYKRFFFGQSQCTEEIIGSGTCLVPIPEKNYPATYEITRYRNLYKRPIGVLRDLLFGGRVHYGTQINPGENIPIPGKGENSWDCDDDAIHSISIGGRSVDEAISKMVESALSTRRRYGGEHMSIKKDM